LGVAIPVAQVVPEIGDRPPRQAHAFGLAPVASLVPQQRRVVQALGQNEDAEGRQADAAIGRRRQEQPPQVARRSGPAAPSSAVDPTLGSANVATLG
jgi:hypothetical protein